MASSGATANLCLWINRGLEALWLLTVFLVPLAFLDRDYARSEAVIAYVEVPKVALLRTLAGLMAVLWLVEWAVQGRVPFSALIGRGWSGFRPSLWLAALSKWLKDRPSRWLFLAVWVYLGTTLLSTVLSSSLKVSLWGEIPGQDGYSAYNVIAYVLLFAVIATHLKTRSQVWRLLGAIVAMGVLVAGYGVLQHYGFDFLDLTEISGGGTRRVTSAMGNTIFAAAVLSMTIPITLTLAAVTIPDPVRMSGGHGESWRQWAWSLTPMGLWAGILTVQLLGIMFTFSRGPWMGTIVALACILGLSLLVAGWRYFWRAALVLGLAGAWSLAFLQWQGNINLLDGGPWYGPLIALAGTLAAGAVKINTRVFGRAALALGIAGVVTAGVILGPTWFGGGGPGPSEPIREDQSGALGERFSSIRTDVLGGFIGGRGTHWKVSWRLVRDHPWFEFDNLSLRWLRPLIGYGPDLFRYAYLLESPPEELDFLPLEPDHAHNYFIHQTVEQGYLGFLSSLGLFFAVFLAGGYMVWRQRQGNIQTRYLLLIGLIATLAGRFLEMMVGLARVSDLTVLWALLAMFAVLPVVLGASEPTPEPTHQQNTARRRNRGRRAVSAVAPAHNWALFWRFAFVAWLIGIISVLTWVKGVDNVRAAVKAGDAVQSFRQGDLEAALASLDRAIELAPDVPVYYNYKANVYLAYQVKKRSIPEPVCSSQKDLGYNECLAFQRYLSDLDGVEKRPFYYRSRLAVANSAYDLRGTDYSIRSGDKVRTVKLRDETIRFYRESLAIVPRSWRISNDLADAYMEAGRPEAALEPLANSLAITGSSILSADALYAQGVAYSEIGDLEQAVRSLERGLSMTYSLSWAGQAVDLLKDSYSGLGRPETIEYFDDLLAQNPKDALAYYGRGQAFAHVGQLERAALDFSRALDIGLKLPEVLAARANTSIAMGNKDEPARMDLTAAVAREPTNPLYHVYLGDFYRARDPDGAMQELNKAIQLDPQFAMAYASRGQLFLDLGQPQQAIQDFDEAVRLDPQSVLAYNSRGSFYLTQGEPRRAIRDFDEAIRLDPQLAKAYTGRGQAYADLGLYERSTEDLDQAIGLESQLAEANTNRWRTYIDLEQIQRARQLDQFQRALQLGQFQLALWDVQRALALGDRSESAEALYLLGVAHRGLGQLEESAKSLEQSLKLVHSAGWVRQALTLLTEAYSVLGTPTDVKSYDELVRQDPENPVSYYRRGKALARVGQFERAASDFTYALEHGLKLPEVFAARANTFIAMGGNDKQAGLDLTAAVAREPINPLYHVYLGNFYRARDPGGAMRELNKAIQLDPQFAMAYASRGELYQDLGQHQRALQELDEAIHLQEAACSGPMCAMPYFLRGLAYFNLGLFERSVEDLTQAIGLDSQLVEAFVQRGKAQAALGNESQAQSDELEAERLKGE